MKYILLDEEEVRQVQALMTPSKKDFHWWQRRGIGQREGWVLAMDWVLRSGNH